MAMVGLVLTLHIHFSSTPSHKRKHSSYHGDWGNVGDGWFSQAEMQQKHK